MVNALQWTLHAAMTSATTSKNQEWEQLLSCVLFITSADQHTWEWPQPHHREHAAAGTQIAYRGQLSNLGSTHLSSTKHLCAFCFISLSLRQVCFAHCKHRNHPLKLKIWTDVHENPEPRGRIYSVHSLPASCRAEAAPQAFLSLFHSSSEPPPTAAHSDRSWKAVLLTYL